MSETGNYSVVRLSGREYLVDLNQPISLSHTIRNGEENPNCFFAPDPKFFPYESGDFVGSIEKGSPVNFYNLMLNPHGSTTHTECVGHIRSGYYLKDCLNGFFFNCYLITVEARKRPNGDLVIEEEVDLSRLPEETEALILRIRSFDKSRLRFSGTNPIFVSKMLISKINRHAVQHLLVEIPSIDREEDGGKLEAHHQFWYPDEKLEKEKTITELIRIPEEVEDGQYLLNLQVLNIALDVSPSNPVIYKLKP